MSIRLKPETVKYPSFMFFVIYNKNTMTWHKGGMKKFISSKYISGAKMYLSCNYAEKVIKNICNTEQEIDNFIILRYEARATEAIKIEEIEF